MHVIAGLRWRAPRLSHLANSSSGTATVYDRMVAEGIVRAGPALAIAFVAKRSPCRRLAARAL